jgi:hypothetical protein
MRRRLRDRKRERERRLLDLGALVHELHRQGKRAPELLQQKAAALTLIDNEVRELEAQLAGEPPAPPAPPPQEEPVDEVTEEADAVEPEEAAPDEAETDAEPSEEHA